MKRLLLSMLCAFSFVQHTAPLDLSSLLGQATAYTVLSAESLLAAIIHFNQERMIAKTCKPLENNAIIDFMRKEMGYIVDDPSTIRIFVGRSDYYKYETSSPMFALSDNVMCIIEPYYNALAAIFEKEELTEQDQQTLNIFRFIIQHETAHIKYKHAETRSMRTICTALPKIGLFELIKRQLNFKGSDILSVLFANGLFSAGGAYMDKQQEYEADSMVATKQAREGAVLFFNNYLKLFKDNPILEFMDRVNTTHPRIIDRLHNIQERLEAQS